MLYRWIPACRAASPDPLQPFRDRLNRWTIPVQIYLPIADLPVNVFLILGMGLAVGFISGMFGIGGGFLMTPLLIFLGVSPAVAASPPSTPLAPPPLSPATSHFP